MNEKALLISDSVKQKAAETGKVVQNQLNDFVEQAKNGSASIRGLALISGFALVVSSVYEIFSNIFSFHLTAVLIAFYSLIMGGVAIAMEVDPEALVSDIQLREYKQTSISCSLCHFYTFPVLIIKVIDITSWTYSFE